MKGGIFRNPTRICSPHNNFHQIINFILLPLRNGKFIEH